MRTKYLGKFRENFSHIVNIFEVNIYKPPSKSCVKSISQQFYSPYFEGIKFFFSFSLRTDDGEKLIINMLKNYLFDHKKDAVSKL